MRLKFIPPMMPELVDRPPEGDDWSHEVKFDGFRTQIVKDQDGIRFYTRRGHDWTAKYRPLRSAITSRPQDLYFVAFDLLHLNGHDLRDVPLEDRREILHEVIPAGSRIQFSEALPGQAPQSITSSTMPAWRAWCRSERTAPTAAARR